MVDRCAVASYCRRMTYEPLPDRLCIDTVEQSDNIRASVADVPPHLRGAISPAAWRKHCLEEATS